MPVLHDYVAKQLADKLKSRVVVWYDERREFQPFVDAVRGGPRASSEPIAVSLGGSQVLLVEYAGSMFELRAAVEPHVRGDVPAPLVIFLPGCSRDHQGSVLMEIEKGGITWEPQLKQLARNVLLQKYTLGDVDGLLSFDRRVSWSDLARAAEAGAAEPPSILRGIFHEVSGYDAMLAAWLVSDARDPEISEKAATQELTKLLNTRLGLELRAEDPLSKLRAVTLRYLLANEFRLDLACDPPAALDGIPKPRFKHEQSAIRELAHRLRTSHSTRYAELADEVEQQLSLRKVTLAPGSLGTIDTFRFEERILLREAGELIFAGKFGDALRLVSEREQSFWVDQDVGRKAHWEATRLMAELGDVAARVRAAVRSMSGDADAWFSAYVAKDGWYRLDQAHRRLEALVTKLPDDADERPLGTVRRAYEDATNEMATGFTRALEKAGWMVARALHQTRVWSEVVTGRPRPVAYFLVDAMRFEMGVELQERLEESSEVHLTAAVASLPSITPIGMAALLPGASASFSVVQQSGTLGARIDETFLPDLPSRKKLVAARVPGSIDLTLDEVLTGSSLKLAKKIGGASVLFVRSQEIDHAGEAGFSHARQVMDTVINNLARAIRRLAAAGVEHAVVTADHGHLFFSADRDESMRIDTPGGETVDLHRRCWIGRGGATPVGCIRVSASSLGYASDLDVVVPCGSGVFRAGGDLAFHHGGPSLQELALPVLTVRTVPRDSARTLAAPVSIEAVPEAVTNRIFSVKLTHGGQQLTLGATSIEVRPILTANGRQVGAVGMAVGASVEPTGSVKLEPNVPVTIAFVLNDDSVDAVRIVVLDPATDAELYRSPTDIPVQLGV